METPFELDKFLSSFKSIQVEILKDKKILKVALNRPKQLNALNEVIFDEIGKLFSNVYLILKYEDIRVILLTGNGKAFSSGLDLKSKIAEMLIQMNSENDIDAGRKAFHFYGALKNLHKCVQAIEKCELPVIAGIHGFCLGGAMSIIPFADIRICTKDAKFSIKEVDIGLTADLGALQKLTKQSGREGLIKKYTYTGEIFTGEDAMKVGIVDEIVENENELNKRSVELCGKISEKSPLVLWGIKRTINFARDNTLESSLDMVATLNSALSQTRDIPESISSMLNKAKPVYPKF
jgi:enoyl-CoA hydratase/carnithine racemase